MTASKYFPGAETVVLDGGDSIEFVDVNLSSFVPPISREASIVVVIEDIQGDAEDLGFVGFVREKGDSSDGQGIPSQGAISQGVIEIRTDTAQTIQYKVMPGKKAYIAVQGCTITEVV